jgi:hypothetical protein
MASRHPIMHEQTKTGVGKIKASFSFPSLALGKRKGSLSLSHAHQVKTLVFR